MPIENFCRYNEQIALSGLPKVEDFETIKNQGYEIIISLCMPSDSKTLKNEESILTGLGLTYMHIPVDFNAPTLKDYSTFSNLLDVFRGRKIWIHCTKNYRVSAFMYLYGGAYHDKTLLHKFWEPNDTWKTFIEMKKKHY